MKKNIIFILLIGAFSQSLKAQSAYHGGKGEGYASAVVSNVTLGINPAGQMFPAIAVFPNPVKTGDALDIKLGASTKFSIEIFNILGQLVFSQSYDGLSVQIPMAMFKQGSYFVHIKSAEFNYVQKITVAGE